jgi:hypothetical protein
MRARWIVISEYLEEATQHMTSIPSRAYRTLLCIQPPLSVLLTVRFYMRGIKITTNIPRKSSLSRRLY